MQKTNLKDHRKGKCAKVNREMRILKKSLITPFINYSLQILNPSYDLT